MATNPPSGSRIDTRPFPSGSRGSGIILVIVGCILLVLFFTLMARSYFSSYISDQTYKWIVTSEMESMLASMEEEALLEARMGMNDPASPFFSFFKEGDTGEVIVDGSRLPESSRLASLVKDMGLRPEQVVFRRLYSTPSCPAAPRPYNTVGMFEVRSTVYSSRIGRSRLRTSIYEYRNHLATIPVPFDRYSFSCLYTSPLLKQYSEHRNPDEVVDACLERSAAIRKLWQDTIDNLKKAVSKLKKAKHNPMIDSDELERNIAVLETIRTELEKGLAARTFHKLQEGDTRGRPYVLHHFGEFPLLVYSLEPSIRLGYLNVPAMLPATFRKAREREERFGGVCRRVAAMLKSSPDDAAPFVEPMRRFVETASACLDAYGDILEIYKQFQDLVHEIGGKGYAAYSRTFGLFSKMDLLAAASYHLDCTGGEEPAAALERLMKRVGYVNGLVFVRTGGRPLRLEDMVFKGRCVIAVDGDVVLRNVGIEEPDRDLVTFIVYGDAELDGNIQAALCCWGRTRFSPHTSVTGTMCLATAVFEDRDEADSVLDGTLTWDTRYKCSKPRSSGLSMKDVSPIYVMTTVAPVPTAVLVRKAR